MDAVIRQRYNLEEFSLMSPLLPPSPPTLSSSSCCNPNFSLTRGGGGRHSVSNNENVNNNNNNSSKTKKKSLGQEVTDADLAKEMNELSFEEREKISEDVHGVAKVHDEAPEFVQECIDELDTRLSKMRAVDHKHLVRAMFLKPSLKTDRAWKLSFLRADEFCVAKTSKRISNYFQEKAVLFGEEKLVQQITMDDLSPEDLRVLEEGYITSLPHRDHSGRPVVFVDTRKLDFDRMTVEGVLRCFWYLIESATRNDETAQKKGLTGVMYCPGHQLSMVHMIGKAAALSKRSGDIIQCLPYRYTSVHVCYDDARIEFVFRTLRATTGRETRLRLRTHYGSALENEYKLRTFGVQTSNLLLQAQAGNNTLARDYVQRCRDLDAEERYKAETILQQQHSSYSSSKSSSCSSNNTTIIIPYPNPNDVLIGRGKPFWTFPGNQNWNQLIVAHLDRYAECSDFEKTCFSMDIVKKLKDTGVRFLRRTEKGWEILDDTSAREKAAIAFRTRSTKAAAAAAATTNSNAVSGNKISAPPALDVPTSSEPVKRFKYDLNLWRRV